MFVRATLTLKIQYIYVYILYIIQYILYIYNIYTWVCKTGCIKKTDRKSKKKKNINI